MGVSGQVKDDKTECLVIGSRQQLLKIHHCSVRVSTIHPCHTAAILSRETKRALFYHAKPRNGNHGDEA